MSKRKSLANISYGLETPADLLGKLKHDANKINEAPHPYDLFNFFVTAAVLHEWCHKHYQPHAISQQLIEAAGQPPSFEALPLEAISWVVDTSCLPNSGQDPRLHIVHALRICIETANASKHYHWLRSSEVTAINDQPEIKDWHQYFFTAVGPGVYIEYANQHYTVEQIRGILVQFFSGLVSFMEGA